MDDFELRLVVSSRNSILPPVLQCRKRLYSFSDDGGSDYYEWGDWEDVPIVFEDEV